MSNRKGEILEKDVESAGCNEVVKLDGIAYKFTSPQRRSVPDRMMVLPFTPVFFVEYKKPGGKTTAGQDREIQRLRDRGHTVYVIDNIEDAKSSIQEHYKKYCLLC